jgi:hypothetical protein
MPIIKDKYAAKGANDRSKLLTRKDNKAIINPVSTGIETQQKQELKKRSFKQASSVRTNRSSINYYNFLEVNSPKLLFVLEKGQSLNDIIISEYNSEGSSNVMSIWTSIGDQTNASFTVSSGYMTVAEGVSYARLLSLEMSYGTTISSADILNNTFYNVNKKIYFYGAVLRAGPSITYSITNV